MTLPNRCDSGGWFTGGDQEWPADPSHFFWPVRVPSLGCTNLVCSSCESPVRSEVKLRLKDGAGEHAAELFEAADWSSSPWVEAFDVEGPPRVYACRCGVWQASYPRPVQDASDLVSVPWSCGGHPLATLPLALDGMEITEPALRDLVRRNYGGWVPDTAPKQERKLFRFWTLRLYGRLFGTKAAGVVAHTAMGHLLDRRPSARFAALHFTWTHPDNPAAETLSLLDPADVALFVGHTTPDTTDGRGTMDLGDCLKRTALKRLPEASTEEGERLQALIEAMVAG